MLLGIRIRLDSMLARAVACPAGNPSYNLHMITMYVPLKSKVHVRRRREIGAPDAWMRVRAYGVAVQVHGVP